jgi:alpha-amylase
MGVLLQGFYKLPPNHALPSPADGDRTVPWWWDHLAAQARELRAVGFSAVWLPPVLKTSSGDDAGADGFGPFDDYDIGSKDQMGSVATRFGTREQLQRCVAMLRANDLDVYLDMVEHHRSGDPGNYTFRYRGGDGTPGVGRFPKDPLNFLPHVRRDPNLGGPPRDDYPFGRELAPINGRPRGYVMHGLIDAADWLTRALDAQGYRLDDVKGLSTDFLRPFLGAKAMAGKFAVGEYFDGNRDAVAWWMYNPGGMQGRAAAFDFPLKFALARMCNNAGGFDMSSLDHAGLAGIAPLSAVTFVDNHDTDLHGNLSPVIWNKILAYAYILTSEGYPCVYYRDYSTDRGCYGLKPEIDNLIWIHEKLAAGPTEQRWKDFDVFAFERLGGPHLLVGLNNDPQRARTITVQTGFGADVGLHDYSGHAWDSGTDGNGWATITIPRNDNGRGYVCYSRHGFGEGFAVVPHPVTQDFEGAKDLDLPPAAEGKEVKAGRIWPAPGHRIAIALTVDVADWTADTMLTLAVADPAGEPLATAKLTRANASGARLEAMPRHAGWHTLTVALAKAPAAAAEIPYRLRVTYLAQATLR